MYNFKKCRLDRGLQQKEVAISLGVKAPSVSDWESGKSNPTLDNLIRLADLYNTTTDSLLGRDSHSDSDKSQLSIMANQLSDRDRHTVIALMRIMLSSSKEVS